MSELDVVLSKINIVKNCLMAIEKAKAQVTDTAFRQSIYELNLQRAVQACIDLAHLILAKEGLGLPATYRQAFEILKNHGVIDGELAARMIAMVGFRNISVHDYEEIKPVIVNKIVDTHLIDFENFYAIALDRARKW